MSEFNNIKNINTGIQLLSLEDTNRLSWDGKSKRPLLTHIFYPTLEKRIEPLLLGEPTKEIFYAGDVIWHGQPSVEANQKKPLIIMSHGTGGAALQMLWIAEALVKKGYIVAGINHHGNTAMELNQSAEGYMLWWERTKDISALIATISNDSLWGNLIDTQKIGVVGFSLGGHTAISSIGGITDLSLFNSFCSSDSRDATCEPQLEFMNIHEELEKVKNKTQVQDSISQSSNSFKIDSIKGAFVISPAVVQSFTEESLKNITVPVSIVIGSDDVVAPAKTNAKRVFSLVKDASYNEIDGAGHYTFLSTCTDFGACEVKELCCDKEGVNRKEIHTNVSNKAVEFFDSLF